jgi:hypothetical protein
VVNPSVLDASALKMAWKDSNSHFGGGDGEEEGRERAKKDWKLRG